MQKSRLSVAVDLHMCLRSNNRVLLIRRFNTGWRDGEYGLPAGHLEAGESVLQGTIRETSEEVGVAVANEDVKLALTMHHISDSQRLALFFEATTWVGTPTNMEPQKCDELLWIHFDEMPRNTVPYIAYALSQMAIGKRYAEFQWDITQ